MLSIFYSLPTNALPCLPRLGLLVAIARFGKKWQHLRMLSQCEGSIRAPKSTQPAIRLIDRLIPNDEGVIPGLLNRDQFTFFTWSGLFRLDPDPT